VEAVRSDYTIRGEGEPLVMVHGVGATRSVWDGVAERLAGRFRCITYDLRGHGRTPTPAPAFGLDELVVDLEALRVELGLDSFHLVGHSLGGMIAPAYAHAHPERVRTLGLLSTVAFRTPEELQRMAAFTAAMRERGLAWALDTLVQRWFTDDFVRAHPEVVEARRQTMLKMDEAIYYNTYAIYAGTDTGPWLPALAMPTLVLTGEFDPSCSPERNRQMAEALPDAELEIYEGLRHSLLIEVPERIAASLERFITARA